MDIAIVGFFAGSIDGVCEKHRDTNRFLRVEIGGNKDRKRRLCRKHGKRIQIDPIQTIKK